MFYDWKSTNCLFAFSNNVGSKIRGGCSVWKA